MRTRGKRINVVFSAVRKGGVSAPGVGLAGGKVDASSKRQVVRPTRFVAEHASSLGNVDTFAGSKKGPGEKVEVAEEKKRVTPTAVDRAKVRKDVKAPSPSAKRVSTKKSSEALLQKAVKVLGRPPKVRSVGRPPKVRTVGRPPKVRTVGRPQKVRAKHELKAEARDPRKSRTPTRHIVKKAPKRSPNNRRLSGKTGKRTSSGGKGQEKEEEKFFIYTIPVSDISEPEEPFQMLCFEPGALPLPISCHTSAQEAIERAKQYCQGKRNTEWRRDIQKFEKPNRWKRNHDTIFSRAPSQDLLVEVVTEAEYRKVLTLHRDDLQEQIEFAQRARMEIESQSRQVVASQDEPGQVEEYPVQAPSSISPSANWLNDMQNGEKDMETEMENDMLSHGGDHNPEDDYQMMTSNILEDERENIDAGNMDDVTVGFL